TTIMAAIQVGAIVYGIRLAKRTEVLVNKFERDVAPIVERLTAMSGDASRATSLAVEQVQKVDRIVSDLSTRIDRTMAAAERALLVPAREGAALAAAVKATVSTLRELKRQQRSGRLRSEEDDALFIG
ncbi:MAG: hypothetical protein AB7I50_24180, partial [Vicinamibacterales bacterium]